MFPFNHPGALALLKAKLTPEEFKKFLFFGGVRISPTGEFLPPYTFCNELPVTTRLAHFIDLAGLITTDEFLKYGAKYWRDLPGFDETDMEELKRVMSEEFGLTIEEDRMT